MYVLTFITTIGALQGVIILLSILARFRHRKNLPLAILLIVFSVRLGTIPTWNPDILISHPWVYPLTAPLPFLFGPLLWWYIRELVSDTLNVPKHVYLHFLPWLFEMSALTITILSMDSAMYEHFVNSVFAGSPPLWLPVRNALKVAANLVYMFLSARIAFGKKSERLSSTKRLGLRLMVIIPVLVLLSFSYVAIIPYVTKGLVQGIMTPFFILSVTMAVLIYTISLLLMIMPGMNSPELKAESARDEQLCSNEECEYLVGLVEKRFSEGAYQNPGLVLSDLASEFHVHPNRLSYAVNHCRNTSFRNLLNSRRIDYFCSLIKEGEHQRQSILAIAFDAGFPSKSTFNRVFKERMGIPPSEYLKQKDIV